MIIRTLHRLGIPSDAFHAMAGASILGSIALWAMRSKDDQAHAERLGIFVGLWAPTFMIIGSQLHTEESNKGLANPQLQAVSNKAEGTADETRRRAEQYASRELPSQECRSPGGLPSRSPVTPAAGWGGSEHLVPEDVVARQRRPVEAVQESLDADSLAAAGADQPHRVEPVR